MTSWRIEIKPSAEKQYLSLDRKTRERIKKSLRDLETHDTPFAHSNVRPPTGKLKGDYRLRVGDWRVLFTPEKDHKLLFVFAILPRSDAY